MTTEPTEIKKWLAASGYDREWLARECRVAKKTVDGWLSTNKPIPGPAERIIQELMEKPQKKTPTVGGLDLDLLFKLDEARNIAGYSSLREFCTDALESAAQEIIEESEEE